MATGFFFLLKKKDDLGPTFTRIAQELHSQYVLGFSPETLDGKIHKLEVRVKRAGAIPRARKSYVATRSDSTQMALVYDAAAPRLRLTWWWRARAAEGPLEHGVRIENIGHENVWLPLQPSLRYAWRTDAAQSLRRSSQR